MKFRMKQNYMKSYNYLPIFNYELNYGRCVGSVEKKVVFMQIPKNAINTIMHMLLETDDGFIAYRKLCGELKSIFSYVAVIRNPLERFISGFAQYMIRTDAGLIRQGAFQYPIAERINIFNDKKILDAFFTKFEFDDHTARQCSFITPFVWHGCELKSLIFFKLDNIYKLVTWFNSKGVNSTIKKKYNVCSENKVKMQLNKGMRNFLNANPKYVDKVNDFYSDDWKLYKAAK